MAGERPPPNYELVWRNQALPISVRYPLLVQMGLEITHRKRVLMLSRLTYSETYISQLAQLPLIQMVPKLTAEDGRKLDELIMRIHQDAVELSNLLNSTYTKIMKIQQLMDDIDHQSRITMSLEEFTKESIQTRHSKVNEILTSLNVKAPAHMNRLTLSILRNCGYVIEDNDFPINMSDQKTSD